MIKDKLYKHNFYSKLSELVGKGTKYFYRHSVSLIKQASRVAKG